MMMSSRRVSSALGYLRALVGSDPFNAPRCANRVGQDASDFASRLQGRTSGDASVVENREVELPEALGVGDHVDLDDLPAPDDDADD